MDDDLSVIATIELADSQRELAKAMKAVQKVEGAQGPQGEPGPVGPQGKAITGPQGPVGRNGADGRNGAKGDSGPPGKDGRDGKDGVGPDEKVRVSKDDPTAGYLADKLTAGNGVEIRKASGKRGERLIIDAIAQGGGGGGQSGIIAYDDGVAVGAGNKVSFDGGSPVTISGGLIHVPVGSGGATNLSDATPLVELGAGDPGVSTDASRGDHQHPAGGGGGVTDHGALTGLADNDHPQYTTDAEAGVIADASVATHAAAGNPHPTYLTQAEGDAAYDALGAAAARAPADATYLVGAAHAGLSAEIVVGATPGGELGGTWASPTIDTTHSGSAHHDPVTVGTGLDVTGQLVELDLSEVAAGGELGGFLDAPTVDASHSGSTHAATQAAAESTAAAALTGHTGDTSDAHDASAVSVVPFATIAATDVQAALEEIVAEASIGHAEDHDHDGAPTQKLAQANTHETPDTDVGPTSLHHTLGTGANQSAAGNHGHTLDFGEAGDISAEAFGDTAAAGATGEIADAGHRHAMPANPVTAHEAAADPHTGYVQEADANWIDLTDGGATTLHSHAGGGYTDEEAQDAVGTILVDSSSVDFTYADATPSITATVITGTTAAAIGTSAGGAAATPSKSDHVHATGAGTPSTQAFGDAAATGTGPAAAMTDHKHAMPADPVTAHAAAGDPHTGYRLESADHSHATTGLQGGTIDHGALTGLGDDDHPQYLTQAEADALYAATGDYIPQGGPLTEALDADFQSIINLAEIVGVPDGELVIRGIDNDPDGSGVMVRGGNGAAGDPGAAARVRGGTGDAGADVGAEFLANPGDGAGGHGKASIKTNNATGASGDVLTAQGDGTALWVAAAGAAPSWISLHRWGLA